MNRINRSIDMQGQRVEGARLRIGQDAIYRPVDPNEAARAKQIAELKAQSPLRSAAGQSDAAHLPLFVTANEPTLF